MNREKKLGIIFSYLSEGIYILTSLLYTPFMLRVLGQNEYGLYQLVASVVAYMSLLSLGFGSSYMRFYSRYKAKEDRENIARLNGIFLIIFLAISLICIVCGELLNFNIKEVLGDKLSFDEVDKARILMHFMIFNMALSFPASIFTSYITAYERFVFQKGLIVLQKIFNPFLNIIILLSGFGSIGLVVVSTVIAVSSFAINVYYCVKKLHIRFIFKDIQFSLLKEMWVFTFFIFLNQIIDQINWNLDKYLLGRMVGTASVAVYSIGSHLNSMYFQLATSISNVFYPQINRIVAESNDNEAIIKLMTKIGRLQFMVLFLFVSGFFFYGRAFIAIWAGDGYENSYYIAMLLFISAFVPLIQEIGLEIQRAKNMHKARSVVYLAIVIMNIFLSIYLIGKYGERGAATGTAVATILGAVIFINWYYKYRMKLDIGYFWKEIFKFSPAAILSLVAGFVINLIHPSVSLLEIVLSAIIYIIIYAILFYLIGMNDSEKNLVHSFTKGFKKSRKGGNNV